MQTIAKFVDIFLRFHLHLVVFTFVITSPSLRVILSTFAMLSVNSAKNLMALRTGSAKQSLLIEITTPFQEGLVMTLVP